jgi:hypothetical protein
MTTSTHPARTFYNDNDGHTYWIEPAANPTSKAAPELWACPTFDDGTPEFSNAIAVNEFAEPLAAHERQFIIAALTNQIRRIVWKDEGRDSEGRSIGPAYAEDTAGEIVSNFDWITWKKADEIAKALQVELQEV